MLHLRPAPARSITDLPQMCPAVSEFREQTPASDPTSQLRVAWHHLQPEPPRQLLRQCGAGEFFSSVKSEVAGRFDSCGEDKMELFD